MPPLTQHSCPGFSPSNIPSWDLNFEWVVLSWVGFPKEANSGRRIQEPIVYLENARAPGGKGKWNKRKAINDEAIIKPATTVRQPELASLGKWYKIKPITVIPPKKRESLCMYILSLISHWLRTEGYKFANTFGLPHTNWKAFIDSGRAFRQTEVTLVVRGQP